MPHDNEQTQQKHRPVQSWGPFHGGVTIALWKNVVSTEQGQRVIPAITISPRRYLDKSSNEWKDSYSYRLSDVQSMILALKEAHQQGRLMQGQAADSDTPATPEPTPDELVAEAEDIPF